MNPTTVFVFPRRSFRLLAFVIMGCWLVSMTSAWAQIERQHGAHIHGQASATFALDGDAWSMTIELPGFNVVGFEYPPQQADEQSTFDEARRVLMAGDWLAFDPKADCHIQSLEIRTPGYEHEIKTDEYHHHHHDHDHDRGGHAQFEIEALGQCQDVGKLNWMAVDLFTPFANNESIEMAVLTDTAVFERVLSEGEQRIEFEVR